jgi:uncharacterized protein (DUF2147 family)
MSGKVVVAGVIAVALAWSVGRALAADGIDGAWLTEDKEAIVEIAPCGGSAARCGKVIWLKTAMDKSGRPVQDLKNPNAQLRTRPLCGLEVLTGLKQGADGGYDGAVLYDPEEGNTVTGAAKLAGADLKVTGYVAGIGKLLSESETWTRASTAFVPCAGNK